MPDLHRRGFLAGLGSLAVAPRLAVPSRAQAAAAPFGWGVASFDPTTTGVLLWTRVAPPDDGEPVPLGWVVASDDALTDVVASGSADATSDADWCVRIDVEGLPPGGTWWYAFDAPAGERSAIGRTRTLPADAEHLRLGVASCARFATAGYAAYRALAGREVDLVVHVGDYIYEDGGSDERAHDPSHRCTTLDDYRTRYAQYRADPDLQALHARHPMVAVGDDHEVAGNAWRDGAADHDDGDGPWLDRLVAANRAHEEWLPGRTGRGPDGRLQAWRSLDLGGLAELLVLDTRAWGRDEQPSSGAELAEAGRSLLGADQAAFAVERLTDPSRAPWVIVANQVMFHPLRLPSPGVALTESLRDRGFLVVDGEAINPDQWDGYPAARDELAAAVGLAGGVVVVTGDVHSSWAWEGPVGGPDSPAMVELVAPSITSSPFADRIPIPASLVQASLPVAYPDLRFVELASHGYLLMDCTLERAQGEWWYVDPSDPSSQRFGGARATPRAAPMRLTEVAEPTIDPGSSTTVPAAAPSATTTTNVAAARDDDDGLPLPAIGGGALAAAAAGAAMLAVRRRRPVDPSEVSEEP